jgi:hypothetical protein
MERVVCCDPKAAFVDGTVWDWYDYGWEHNPFSIDIYNMKKESVGRCDIIIVASRCGLLIGEPRGAAEDRKKSRIHV